MSPIKDLQMIYTALNEGDTFSAGDTVEGAVTFTLKKETKVKSVLVKLKGEARVRWREGTGDDKKTHSDRRRYFKVKEYLVAQNAKGTVLPHGVHHFNFKLKIPQRDMPSSLKGVHGEIVYLLEVKLSRSWRWPTGVQRELNFMSKSPSSHHGQVMCPRSGSVDKEVGVFSKGQVQLSATVDRKVCSPGDTISVVAKIANYSSKAVRPKFSLQKEIKYRAGVFTNTSDQSLCKEVGDMIKVNSEETVSCQLKIPVDVTPTLHNCEIISADYYLKVYLDISFAIDPEVRFPLVIVPRFIILQSGEAVGPSPPGAIGAPSYSDFPVGPPATGAYGYPAPDPAQLVNTSGYNNQWPQQAAPYGFPAAAFPPSLGQHQAPNAPPLFQQGEPPAYTSLYPSSHDPYSSTKSDKEK